MNQSCQVIRSRTEAKAWPGAVRARIMRPAMPETESSYMRDSMAISSYWGAAQSIGRPWAVATVPCPAPGVDPAHGADYQ